MAVEKHGDLHGNPSFDAVKRKSEPVGFDWHSSSQARGNPREIFYLAAVRAMLHAVESTVGGAQKLFRGIAILRKCGNSRADRKRGRLRLRRETFANSGNHASSSIRTGFRKHEGKFVAAVARGCIDGARMGAEDPRESNDGAASGEMALLIIDSF
jgi:hypothetical protein